MSGFSIRRDALYEEIWSLSATKVAEKYDLSYARLLKACRENDIPIPPPGYYTKLSIGKPVDRAPLPDSKIEMIVIEAPVPKKESDPQKEHKQPPASIPESA